MKYQFNLATFSETIMYLINSKGNLLSIDYMLIEAYASLLKSLNEIHIK